MIRLAIAFVLTCSLLPAQAHPAQPLTTILLSAQMPDAFLRHACILT